MRIWFDRTDPPAGQLRLVAAPGASSNGPAGPTQFTGWLGLLRVLSDALGGQDEDQRQP